MKQTLRTQLFLKTIYNEASPLKAAVAADLIAGNWNYKEEFQGLKETKNRMPSFCISPAEAVLEAVRKYSRGARMSFEA